MINNSVGECFCIIAWNPNGIRSLCDNHGNEINQLTNHFAPDIIVFNETKGNSNKQQEMQAAVDKYINGEQYQWFWNNSSLKAGQHGCCVAVKKTRQIISVNYGFEDGIKEPEGRLITIEFSNIIVVGLYGVNSGSDRLEYKIQWIRRLWKYMNILRLKRDNENKCKPVIATGDFNIAPMEIDVFDSAKCQYVSGFLMPERMIFAEILADGWIDLFRYCNPENKSWSWGARTKSKDPTKDRKLYNGMRIDHCLVHKDDIGDNSTLGFKLVIESCNIINQCKGSDHCPVVSSFKLIKSSNDDKNLVISSNIPVKPKVVTFPVICTLKRSDEHGIIQGCDIYIGRKFCSYGWDLEGSIWGNPYRVNKQDIAEGRITKINALSIIVRQYEEYIRYRINTEPNIFYPMIFNMLLSPKPMRLGCFCVDSTMCHGEVILKLLREFANNGYINIRMIDSY